MENCIIELIDILIHGELAAELAPKIVICGLMWT